jgi:hypothetical protein
MAFPFTLSGRIWLEQRPMSVETILRGVEDELKRQRALRIERRSDTIYFAAGLFRSVGSWNILVPIDHGTISVLEDQEGTALVYHLSYVQLFLVASVMIFGLMGPVIWTESNLSLVGKTAILGFMWIWLVGGNLVISAARFPAFLRRVVAQTAQTAN